MRAAGIAVDDRNRGSPVSLTGNPPIFETELHLPLARPLLFRPRRHAADRLRTRQPAELAGLDKNPRLRRRGVEGLPIEARPFLGLDHHGDRQVVLPGELKISLVVGGDSHDGARSVLGQHKVSNPDRHTLTGKRVDHAAAGIESFLVNLSRQPDLPVQRAKAVDLLPKPSRIRIGVRDRIDERVLGG